MRIFVALLLTAAFATFAPASAADGKAGRRSCQHMCPVAQAAAHEGYRIVSDLTLATVDLSELEL